MFPHPVRERDGHSYGQTASVINANDAETVSQMHAWAVDLFNHGYYWESHEAWEALWHAFGPETAEGRFLKGLIKLAAAGVKARQGSVVGIERHVTRAAELFNQSAAEKHSDALRRFGLDAHWLSLQCGIILSDPTALRDTESVPVRRVMPFVLTPGIQST